MSQFYFGTPPISGFGCSFLFQLAKSVTFVFQPPCIAYYLQSFFLSPCEFCLLSVIRGEA